MALKNVLIAFTCALTLPAVALAQSPVQKMANMADCCVADDGTATAAAVLLPPVAAPASDACCQPGAVSTAAVDHSAHLTAPAAKAAGHAEPGGGMACCDHGAQQAQAKPEAACCADTKDGCDMPCCAAMPPKR
jgi:hypothetical protein